MSHLPRFCRFPDSQVSITDSLLNHIIYGEIMVKSNVKEFKQTAIISEDGSTVENTDVVIFATDIPSQFLSLEILRVSLMTKYPRSMA